MSSNDDMFNGGGTPLNNLSLKPQPRPQVQTRQNQAPQMQPGPPGQGQEQMSPQQMQQMQQQMYQRQMQQQQQQQQQQQMYPPPNKQLMKQGDAYMDKMKVWCGDLWKETALVAVVFFIFSNSFSYDMQNKFIPYSLRFEGCPSTINIIINSIVSAIVFFLVTKFVIQK
jgi:hypothetical protein